MPKQNTAPFPHKPRLTLQVGVTGHRPCRLPDDSDNLTARVAETLQTIAQAYREFARSAAAKKAYDAESPALRLLSPLAEGADRIAAACAIDAGYELQCPLPFLREHYAEDFAGTPGSLDEFNGLLGNATKILELDGNSGNKPQAYNDVGHYIAEHTDILLAVWGGKQDDTSSGTDGIVTWALQQDLPIFRIDAVAPHDVSIHLPGNIEHGWLPCTSETFRDRLFPLLESLLLPPNILAFESTNSENASHCPFQFWGKFCAEDKNSLTAYFSDNKLSWGILCTVYRIFFGWFGKRRLAVTLGHDYRLNSVNQWHTLAQAAPESLKLNIDGALSEHFIHADSLASFYADRYRGMFISCYMLGGLAVLFALLGSLRHGGDYVGTLFAVLELTTIVLILFLIIQARRENWHKTRLDFRLLAEQLKQQAVLAPIGGIEEGILPSSVTDADHSHAWIDWLVQSVRRANGIEAVAFDSGYRLAYRDYLAAVIDGQADHHKNSAQYNGHIAEAIHCINALLSVVIIIACAVHFFQIEALHFATTIATVVFPAFGATFAGILSQGEFERLAQRSGDMAKYLGSYAENLKGSKGLSRGALLGDAWRVIHTMGQELSDWRVIVRAKAMDHPHL